MKSAYVFVLLALAGCDSNYSITPDTKGGIWVVDARSGVVVRYCKYGVWSSVHESPGCMKAE